MPTIAERFKRSWNAFVGRDPTLEYVWNEDIGVGYSYRPDKPRLLLGNDRSIVTTVYNRIAIDVASIDIEHVRLDSDGRYKETIYSALNNCLCLEANVDQASDAFIRDVVMSMFDEGCVAIVPTDTDINPLKNNSFEVLSMRTGKIVSWHPQHVRVNVYDERDGLRKDIVLPKDKVAIVENPLYSIMNEPNSTLQRLVRTLNRLDVLNEKNSSSKLDLIIQLPYVIRSKLRQEQAESRKAALEDQLVNSKYGIAYTDGTEKITQLNRPVENNLWQQAQDLTTMLFNQLGLTASVFDGTADEKTMINYYDRTIDPICNAIAKEMTRKFITKTARSQGQAIRYFRDPFRLVPVSQLADIADKFTRNEIMSSNELRAEIGKKPVDDPRADELRNKNLNASEQELNGEVSIPSTNSEEQGLENEEELTGQQEVENPEVLEEEQVDEAPEEIVDEPQEEVDEDGDDDLDGLLAVNGNEPEEGISEEEMQQLLTEIQNMFDSEDDDDELEHSVKGSVWNKHKYIQKIGNRYIYSRDQLKNLGKNKSSLVNDIKTSARARHERTRTRIRDAVSKVYSRLSPNQKTRLSKFISLLRKSKNVSSNRPKGRKKTYGQGGNNVQKRPITNRPKGRKKTSGTGAKGVKKGRKANTNGPVGSIRHSDSANVKELFNEEEQKRYNKKEKKALTPYERRKRYSQFKKKQNNAFQDSKYTDERMIDGVNVSNPINDDNRRDNLNTAVEMLERKRRNSK